MKVGDFSQSISSFLSSLLQGDMIISKACHTIDNHGCVRASSLVALCWECWGWNPSLGLTGHKGATKEYAAALTTSSSGLYDCETSFESYGEEWNCGDRR